MLRLMAVPAARGEVFNVGNDEEVTINRLAQLVVELTHSTSPIERVPYEKAYEAGFEDMRRRRPVLSKLEAVTGFRPRTTLQQILEQTAKEKGPSCGGA